MAKTEGGGETPRRGATAVWSAKGGSGVTVTAALLGAANAQQHSTVLVDFCGDLPAALGVPEPAFGVTDWLMSGEEDGQQGLDRLLIKVFDGLLLLPRGDRPLACADRATALVGRLASKHRAVICDLGCLSYTGASESRDAEALPADIQTRRAVARSAQRSLLVTQACFLSLRRACRVPVPINGVLLQSEDGRALDASDIADILGGPVVDTIPRNMRLSVAVDSGLLAARLPAVLADDTSVEAVRDLAAIADMNSPPTEVAPAKTLPGLGVG